MNTKQLEYVLTLSREGSFSRAAEVLNIRQPSLSQYIKKIEQDAGIQLFNRLNGEVLLTDAGRAYIAIGRKILDLEHQLDSKFSDLSLFKTGSIVIGISAHRSVALIPQVAKKFKDIYPGLILQIVEKKRADLLEAAEHGEFDLVITTLPVDKDHFTYETLFIEENVVATTTELQAKEMKGRKFPAISATVLNHQPFAMLNKNHLMQKELDELIKTHKLDLKKTVECTSLEALVEMVKEGMGSAFIPACLAKDLSLHYYSIKETIPKREIVVMYRKEQYLSKAVIDLKEQLHIILG